jgi:peptidoglycan/xylan/chitin deacetylase (PgdA/CDA1 family)
VAQATVTTRALMYHGVVADHGRPDGFAGPGAAAYSVAPARFAEHLEQIAALTAGPPARVDAVADGTVGRRAWLLTFDDGAASALEAAEQLARRSWPAHFFIATDLVGNPGFLGWDDVRGLACAGHVIGSHSCSHPHRMAACSWEQLLHEWSRSADVLAEALGRPVSTASVPGGLYSPRVGRAAAAAGFATLFTSVPSQRLGSIDGCLLIGRYAIRRDTPAAEAAAAAAGRAVPWARQRVAWELRGAAKRIGGGRYEHVRRALLARR